MKEKSYIVAEVDKIVEMKEKKTHYDTRRVSLRG